jgi:aminotransferase
MINLFEPSVGDEELAAVRDVFTSRWLGEGGRVDTFRREFGVYIGATESSLNAVNSCTEGLFQAVAALDFGPTDEVILPSVSFVGAAQAVQSTGAVVVLCDVDPMSLNPSVGHIEQALTPRTKAILILHFGGKPGAVSEIADLARERSITLIEDTACAMGSFSNGKACGTFGDIGVWSFDSMKTLTTGDGGMVWTRDELLGHRIRLGTTNGVPATGFEQRRKGSTTWWRVEPEVLGRRSTMNDLAASIGIVQLQKLPDVLCRRRTIAQAYRTALASVEWIKLPDPHPTDAAQTYYWIQVDPPFRDQLARFLLDRGIYSSFRYWPLHRMAMYGCDVTLPGSDLAADRTLLLPLHQGLADADVEQVIESVRSFNPQMSSHGPRQKMT